MTAARYDLDVPARKVAWVVWASMVATPVLFFGVVRALDEPIDFAGRDWAEVLLLLALLACGVGLTLARELPPRIPLRQAGGRVHVAALLRLVVGWSICEGVALFPLVGYLLTRDLRLLGPAALGVLALLFWYPSRARWKAALPPGDEKPPPPRSSRMVH